MKLKEIKGWSPEIEKEITDDWRKEEKFTFSPKTKKKIYSIDTPPPYVNAPVHIGQAITYCYMDMFARYRRMKGFDVLFPLGLDRNGLPIEMAAEKRFKVSPFKVGRVKFIDYCKKLLNETSSETEDTFAKLGISFTSYKEGKHTGAVYLTDSPEYRSLTQATFIDLFKKGLIYEDTRINNWDPKLQTTIADSEIEYKELNSTFNDIKWKVKGMKEEIVIGTTRPELIATCGMVIFNPEDKRYKKFEGKKAITPLFNKEVPIKAHPLAQIDKGTGLAMMCSAGDLSDIQFFREMELTPVIAINKDGTMNKHAGFLEGLKVREARKMIIEELKKKNLLVKQEQIMHRTPISERSGAEIEFIEMPEFYLRQLEFKDKIKAITNKIEFYPSDARKLLESWIDSIAIDWPISRRRYYGTPIPLWYSEDLTAIPKPGKYYEPWTQSPPADAEVFKNRKKIGSLKDFKDKEWKGEERIFDTWMDSSISELQIIKYQEDPAFFKKAYPVSLRPQGKDIIRTWLYYTILRGYLETKEPCFKDVWINQHIVDEKGRKMSKSLGNVIDPKDLLKEYGAEAIRFWSAIEGDLTRTDFNCSKDKIRAELKTLTKMLNIAKFISQFEKPKKAKLSPLDQLFTDYMEDLTEFADKAYERYDFNKPALKLRNFVWETFASHYIELVKARVYNQDNEFTKEESNAAKYTLHTLFERFLLLAYPIIPQITSLIAEERKIDLHTAQFPKTNKTKFNSNLLGHLIAFNGLVWREKQGKNLSLKEPLKGMKIPKELEKFQKDLKACHRI